MLKKVIERMFPRQAERYKAKRRYQEQMDSTGEFELTILSGIVPNNAISLDVGGNVGTYAYHLSLLSSSVVTFECNPDYAERLRWLNFPDIRVEEVVLSDRAGEAVLRVPLVAGKADEGMASVEASAIPDDALHRTYKSQMKTLDSYNFKNVGIKIDVEGHEEAVFRGAADTIHREKPILLIEIEERHNPGGVGRIRDELTAQGYQGWFFENGKKTPISEFSPERHQRITPDLSSASHNRRLLVTYINNFLFTPPQR